jgi:excisionase family DNA binding protein
VTAKPVRTDFGDCGKARRCGSTARVINRRELHWHLRRTVWPTEASAQAGGDRREKLLLTVREAADLLSVSRSRVYELIYAEQLDSVKIGRSRRVSLASVRRLAEGPSAA